MGAEMQLPDQPISSLLYSAYSLLWPVNMNQNNGDIIMILIDWNLLDLGLGPILCFGLLL